MDPNYTVVDLVCALENVFPTARFSIICCGSFFASLGVVSNLFLTYIFAKSVINQPILAILAGLDTALCSLYILLFGVEALAYEMEVKFAYDLLYSYNKYCFALSRIVQLSIPAMLIVTTVERWAWLYEKRYGAWRWFHKPRYRGIFGIAVLLIVCVWRLPVFWSLHIYVYDNCSDYFQSKEVWPSQLYTKRWFINYELGTTVVQVFGPFIALLTFNIAIVWRLHSKSHEAAGVRGISRRLMSQAMIPMSDFLTSSNTNVLLELRAHQNVAIVTMVVILVTYILCNTFHVVLFCLEKWWPDAVSNELGWTPFYALATDILSFGFLLCSAVRPVIYYKLNAIVRQELKSVLAKWVCKGNFRKLTENGAIELEESSISEVNISNFPRDRTVESLI